MIFLDEWDDELRLKRNQLDVLQAHNRFIQTKEEINRRNSGITLEASSQPEKTMDKENNNESLDFVSAVDTNSNENMKDTDATNDNILVDCTRTSLKSV